MNKKMIITEMNQNQKTIDLLMKLKSRIDKEEMPFSINEKNKTQIANAIHLLDCLLTDSNIALESALDDYEAK